VLPKIIPPEAPKRHNYTAKNLFAANQSLKLIFSLEKKVNSPKYASGRQ
jgi:hypothetical protein